LALLRKLKAGDRTGAAAEFAVWDKAHVDGRLVVVAGLTRRRTAEAGLFTDVGVAIAPYH
jgi:lysozyme